MFFSNEFSHLLQTRKIKIKTILLILVCPPRPFGLAKACAPIMDSVPNSDTVMFLDSRLEMKVWRRLCPFWVHCP